MATAARVACSLLLYLLAAYAALGQNPAVIPVFRAEPWWTARHEAIVKRIQGAAGAQLLFVGDSITQNYENTGPEPNEVFAPIWQEFFAPHQALNLGYSGDQTQHVLWRLAHGEVDGISPANIVLMIGTNNTADTLTSQTVEQVTVGVEAVVDLLHARLPTSRLLVIGILPSGISAVKSAKDGAINSGVCSHYAAATFARCLDLTSLFVKDGNLDTSLFYDPQLTPARPPLHPNTQGQYRMAKAISAALYGPASR